MITSRLIYEYEAKAGPLEFTLARIPPEQEEQIAEMMQAVIDGKRARLTDADIDAEIPRDAES